MQAPIIFFDHLNKTVSTIQPGPTYDQKVNEAAQQSAAATPGPHRPTA